LPVSFRSANRRPARKRRWFAESEGFAVDSFEMDFRLGELLATQELPDVDP
jgi:hypothetical protein